METSASILVSDYYQQAYSNLKLSVQNLETGLRRTVLGTFVLLVVVAAGYMVFAGKSIPAWPDSFEYVLDGPVASFIASHPTIVIAPFLFLAIALGLLVSRKRDS